MSRIIPSLNEDDLKRLPSSAEAKVYRACRDLLDERAIVIFSLPWIRVSAHGTPRDGETDFIVFDEAGGILVIEVKGGGVRVDAASGSWCSLGRQGETHAIKDPFRQATSEKYALLDYLRSCQNWTGLKLRPTLGHAVIFPDLDDVSGLAGIDRPQEIIGTRGDVGRLARWIEGLFRFWANGPPTGLGAVGMKIVDDVFCKAREVRPLLCHQIDEEEKEHIRLTEEQSRVLRALNRYSRARGANLGEL